MKTGLGLRPRQTLNLTLSPIAIAMLKEIAEARGTRQSGAVERLIRDVHAELFLNGGGK